MDGSLPHGRLERENPETALEAARNVQSELSIDLTSRLQRDPVIRIIANIDC